jgi:hypothetical protein
MDFHAICFPWRSRPSKMAPPSDLVDQVRVSVALSGAHTGKGPPMANPHPTPKVENLRPPWPKGTSGNPAGYSRGRRISDAIERQIDEMELDREFGATAIAMALGKKHLLKQKVKDPETGKDIWVEQKPDLAWFKMIAQRIEPVAEQTDAVSRLRAILDDIDSELAAPVDQSEAAESPERSRSDPCDCNENVESAEKLFQAEPARVDSGQVALKVLQTLPRAGNLVTSLAVERRIGHRRVPTLRGLLELFNPARHAVQLFAFLEAQVAGLFTGGVRRFLPGNIRIRPRSGGGLRRALAEVVVVAFFLLFHQAVVLDHQRAGAYGVQAGAVVADEQHGSLVVHRPRLEPLQGLDIQVSCRLVHDQLPRHPVSVEVAAEQVGAHPQASLTRSPFPVLYLVLAPERDPRWQPPPNGEKIKT